MSYKNSYLPIPPRAWSRVQNSCSLITDIGEDGFIQVPYTNELVPIGVLEQKLAMLNKGNVLQYKANSSNLTQAQKYSKIAQGKWTNRNTTWATQNTRGYTNPNNSSLKRSGNVTNISIDPITGAIIGQTTAPVTCPKPVTIVNEALPPNEGGGSIQEPDIPPPIEPTPESETFPETIPETPVEPIVIQDEGILICSIQENICTGETKSTISQQLCNPTSDSDVPGQIELLCWNDGTPTWYPRSRYIMSNSTNKWPVNYKLFTSAITPVAPIITSITANSNFDTLTWIETEICLPISRFDIYQNEIFVKSVPGDIYTANIDVKLCGIYIYYIIAVTNGSNISSEKSNIVSINRSSSTPPQSAAVNWAATDFYDISMDVNITFNNPLFILCGNPLYFVVSIYNSLSELISTQNISYVSGNFTYAANFNDITYSKSGTVIIYLVSIDSNTGKIYNGESVSCNYISSGLPIYINTQINTNRTEVSFNVITESYLCENADFIYLDTDFNQIISYYWTAIPIISTNLTIIFNVLANNEYEYFIRINSNYFNLPYFPQQSQVSISNRKGIQSNIF